MVINLFAQLLHFPSLSHRPIPIQNKKVTGQPHAKTCDRSVTLHYEVVYAIVTSFVRSVGAGPSLSGALWAQLADFVRVFSALAHSRAGSATGPLPFH